MCEALKWTHLPEAGGLYNQHPKLLEQWRYIFVKRSEYEQDKQRQEESKARQSQMSGGKGRSSRVAGRRPR